MEPVDSASLHACRDTTAAFPFFFAMGLMQHALPWAMARHGMASSHHHVAPLPTTLLACADRCGGERVSVQRLHAACGSAGDDGADAASPVPSGTAYGDACAHDDADVHLRV